MARSVLLIGGVVVVGAGIALAMVLAGGGDAPVAGTGTAKTQTGTSGGAGPNGAVGTGSSGTGGAGGGTTTDLGPRPTLPAGTQAGSGAEFQTGQNPTPPVGPYGVHVTTRGERGSTPPTAPGDSYSVGDVKMRDHRGSGAGPIDVPPNVHTPEGPRIDSTLTSALGKQVRTVIHTCAKDASREGRGAKPRVDGQLIINVQAGNAIITSSVMQPHDVSDAVAATLKACIEPKLVGISATATGQADLDNYGINITTQLP